VVKTVVSDTPYVSAKSFEELGLSAELLQGRAGTHSRVSDSGQIGYVVLAAIMVF
jgi:hypothetical protein